LKLHEYQGKELFRRGNVAVPAGKPAFTLEEASAALNEIPGPPWVVKAQIHAGGRGKGGGVKLARSTDEAKAHAKAILGMKLVTHQTGPEGRAVRRLLIEQGCEIASEFYLGLVLDRSRGRVTFIACSEGGMEIEELAVKSPEKIVRLAIDPNFGLFDFQLRSLAKEFRLAGPLADKLGALVKNLYRVYLECDATLVEVNPLVVTKQGEILALDAKVILDDNALYRHPELAKLRDEAEEDRRELEAGRFNLNYISLDGNIGCMVNGAGLAMATMDLIKLCGAEPANFLDVGGGVSQEQVREAFRILFADPRVKGVLVNIFGGIVRCDVIARGIVEAAKTVKIDRPLVVRLEGTNVEEGRKILHESGLPLVAAQGMAEAAKKIVELVRGK
jgi:succinyl-CoA synthetase beta subunit